MAKIPKNLSDAAMFKGYKESKKGRSLFDIAKDFDDNHLVRKETVKKEDSYIDKYLFTALNKELLKLKLDLYKEGIVDYQIKLKRDGQKILLYPVVNKHSKRN